jgi:iron complex outermembrane receptor protein
MTKFTGYTRSPLAIALAMALLPVSGVSFAQTESEEDSDEASQLEQIVVVGSRIKRAEIEGPAPVTVITREDIDREGFQTVGDVLQTLNQNTTSSFTGDLAVTGFSPNAQVVNLRNLGPGYTLTLVNGRRPAQYPQPYNRDNNVVNVRAIPTSIVERIEVLAGGASAIYGSDAVAGVVNIVTRTNFEGQTVRGTVGTTAEGGGDSIAVEFTGGATGDRWNVLYALQAGYNEPVFADQREFLADTRNGPLGPEFTNPALSLIVIRGSGLGAPGVPANQNAFYPGEAACDAFGYTTRTTAARGTYCGSFTQVASRSIFNKGEAFSVYSYGTFDISDETQLFGSVNVYDTTNKGSSGTEFWGTNGDQFLRTSLGGTTALYFDPQFGHLAQLQRIFNPFELGGNEAASTIYDERAYDILVGVNGTLADRFDWEAFASHGVYDYELDRPRLLAQAIHDYFLGPLEGFSNNAGTAAGTFPIHRLNLARWASPITPEIYRSFATRVSNVGDTSSSTIGFNFSGDLFELPAGPVGFAGVVEGHRQTVDLNSDDRLDPLRPRDSQTVYNLVSSGDTEGTRDRYALGAEFRIPVFSMLTAQLAGRYDQYDDISQVDDAVTYQLGLEFRPWDFLLFRGNYATSFRAPDMQLVYAEGAASFASILDEYQCRSGTGGGAAAGPRTVTQCNVAGDPTIYQTQTTIAGNPLLKEEEGESYTYGFVWDIMDGMSFSADFYRIKLEDAASQLTSAFLLLNEANCRLGVDRDGTPFEFGLDSAFCQNILGLVTRQVAPGTIQDERVQRINSAYINTALSDTSGIDANFRYNWETDRLGAFRLDIGYSHVLTDKFKQFADDELIDFRDDLGNFNQRSRVRGSLTWEKGDWTSTVFGTRYGSNGNFAEAEGCNAAGTCYGGRLPPYMLYNLQVGKRWSENLNTTFTVVNVLDNQYRYDDSQTGYPFFQYYLGADPMGRRFYMTAEYKF